MPVLDESEHTARKHHECVSCPREIRPGDRYMGMSGVDRGEWFSQRQHISCWTINKQMHDEFMDRVEVWEREHAGEPGVYDGPPDPFGYRATEAAQAANAAAMVANGSEE